MDLRQKIIILGLNLLVANCWASPLEQKLGLGDSHRLTSDLVRLCTSTDPDRLAYCDGYIESAIHSWKLDTACSSLEKSDLSFCAGAKDADEMYTKALEACKEKDCDMAKSSNDLKIIMGVCKPDKHHDEHYCSGYNAHVVKRSAFQSIAYPNGELDNPHRLGLVDATTDEFVAIMGSTGQYREFLPCISITTTPKQVRNIFLKFVRENPEQQVNSVAIMILEKALYYDFCPGPTPQQLKPHLENCIKWGGNRKNHHTRNICNKAVEIVFTYYVKDKPGFNYDRQVIQGKTSPKDTRLSSKPSLFTVCPVGYVSSVPFTKENKEDIWSSKYSCVRK